MTTILLGRDQYIELDGQRLSGTRQFDVDVTTQEVDVTSWQHNWKSTLPVCADVTVALTIYGTEDVQTVRAKFNQHPPVPVTISISTLGAAQFLPTQLKAGCPVDGVMSFDATFKGFQYEA